MQVRVTDELAVELVDTDNFRRFDVQVELPLQRLVDVTAALANFAELEGVDAAWIHADWIADVANSGEEWLAGFGKMVAYARGRGWTRDAPLRIRAHILWSRV